MTYVVGAIAAKLQLDNKAAFDAGLRGSGKAFESLKSIASSGMRAAGTATDVASVSALALGTKVFSAGKAYNQLQQNSRVALQTLIGSAEGANAQMDKLDAFAKNSPFSKSTFIQAQQQMLGFGIEAEKVVPYLDAIQNAVAGFGGSNADIEGIVAIISKVRSSATFGQEDLNQLADRGINAAALIAQAQGKTEAEFRESIYGSPIKGAEALAGLDALIAGMDSKFAGTTDKIKQQMSGAEDRVKAATRDIGAALARPFVDPNGGGKLVDWTNQFADLLRAVEKKTTPFTNWAVTKLNPAFQMTTRLLNEGKDAVNGWRITDIDSGLRKIAGYGPAIGLTAGALASFGPLAGVLARFGFAVNPVLAAMVGLVATSPELRTALLELLRAGEPLIPVFADVAKTIALGINGVLPVATSAIRATAQVVGPLADGLQAIPSPVLAAAAAFVLLHTATKRFSAEGSSAVTAFDKTAAAAKTFGRNIEGMGRSVSTANVFVVGGNGEISKTSGFANAASSGLSLMGKAATGVGNALKGAFLSNPIGIALTVISTAVAIFAAANANAQQKVEDHRQAVESLRGALNQTDGAVTEASRNIVKKALIDAGAADQARDLGLSLETVTSAAEGNAGAVSAVNRVLEENRRVAAANTEGMASGTNANKSATAGAAEYNEKTKILTDTLAAQRKALYEAQSAILTERREMQLAAAAADAASNSNRRFNDALSIVRDVTKSAEERLDALKDALDELRGGTLTAAEAETKLSATNLDLAEGLAATDEAGSKLWQNTLDGAGKINIATREGINFADQLTRTRDAQLQAIQSAYDYAIAQGEGVPAAQAKANAAGQGYIDNLTATMKQAGLTDEQIAGLIGTYLEVPGTVTTLMTDNGTLGNTEQGALNVINMLAKVPGMKEVLVKEPLSPEVIGRLRNLGFVVENLPGGVVKVTSTGEDAVEQSLRNLTRTRYVTIQTAIQQGADPGAAKAAYDREDGGIHNYEDGGIRSYSTGIYNPSRRGLIKFAEKNVNWEAFISGKAGQEGRNRAILKEVGRRLGVETIPISQLRAARSAVQQIQTGGSMGVEGVPAGAVAPIALALTLATKGGIDILKYIDVQIEAADARQQVVITNGKREQ